METPSPPPPRYPLRRPNGSKDSRKNSRQLHDKERTPNATRGKNLGQSSQKQGSHEDNKAIGEARRGRNHGNNNLCRKLFQRQVEGTRSWQNLARFFAVIPKRLLVPLEDILDRRHMIASGCVLLGFTRDGNHIVSYSCRMVRPPAMSTALSEEEEDEEEGASSMDCPFRYRMQWWFFGDGRSPLRLVAECDLFTQQDGYQYHHANHNGNSNGQPLRITFIETPNDVWVVQAWEPPSTNATVACTTQPCFLSIVPSPLGFIGSKYQRFSAASTWFMTISSALMKHNPRLTFMHPNAVMINMGSEIRIVEWEEETLMETISTRVENVSSHPLHFFVQPSYPANHKMRNGQPESSNSLKRRRSHATNFQQIHHLPVSYTGFTRRNHHQLNSFGAIRSLVIKREWSYDVEQHLSKLSTRLFQNNKLKLLDYDLSTLALFPTSSPLPKAFYEQENDLQESKDEQHWSPFQVSQVLCLVVALFCSGGNDVQSAALFLTLDRYTGYMQERFASSRKLNAKEASAALMGPALHVQNVAKYGARGLLGKWKATLWGLGGPAYQVLVLTNDSVLQHGKSLPYIKHHTFPIALSFGQRRHSSSSASSG